MKNTRQSIAITIASVFACFINRQFDFQSKDELLILEALRRSKKSLENAPIDVLGDYVRDMNTTQLQGLANNVKGIYHELLVEEGINSTDDGLTAEVFPNTNHPGADIVIKNGDQIIKEVQLKATDNIELVERHLDRYPEIPVAATTEVAEKIEGVHDTGFLDSNLEREVSSTLENLSDEGAIGNAEDVVVVSSIIASTKEALAILQGKKNINDASGQALQDVSVAVSTSFMVNLLFNV